MPPSRRLGAPPTYGARYSGGESIFSHGQPLHPGSWRPFVAMIILVPLLITPMILTCLVWAKTSNMERTISVEEVNGFNRRALVIRVLEIIAAVVSIPLVSSLLARAAVACTQRSQPEQSLSLQQLAALADRKWLDMTLPYTYLSPFSCFASFLLLLTLINIPLRAVLIPYEPRQVIMCHEAWASSWIERTFCGGSRALATEPELAERSSFAVPLDTIPSFQDPIIQTIIDDLEAIDMLHDGDYDWHRSWPDTPVWESTVPPDTNTGFVRQHALRYNSSAECESVRPEDLPAECDEDAPGPAAWTESFVVSFVTEGLRLRICVPREGWERFAPHRDAQQITEYMYLSAQARPRTQEEIRASLNRRYDEHDLGNATVRCTATTTRGFFELASDHNGGLASDILAEWPSPEVMSAQFSDYGPYGNVLTRDVVDTGGAPAQVGPVMRVAQAFFGPTSYFSQITELYENSRDNVTANVLGRLPMPLGRFVFSGNGVRGLSFQQPDDGVYPYPTLPREEFAATAHTLVTGFAREGLGTSAFSAAVHVANKAFFKPSSGGNDRREIVFHAGDTIFIPRASVAGLAAAAILVSIQVVLIIALWVYVNFKPTWAESLDALAMMKLGAHLQGKLEFPELGKTSRAHNMTFLRQADGLIGTVDDGNPVPASADVELANMAPRRRETAAPAAPPLEPPRVSGEGGPDGRAVEQAPLPQVSVQDADAVPSGDRPLHRRLSLSSLGRPASPPPSYYGSDVTGGEQVMKGPYTLAVGGTGILDHSLWRRHRQIRGERGRR